MVAGMLSRYFAYLFFLSAYRGALLPGRVDRRLPLARLLLFDEKVTAPCCTTRKFVDFAGGPAKRSWIGRTKSGGRDDSAWRHSLVSAWHLQSQACRQRHGNAAPSKTLRCHQARR